MPLLYEPESPGPRLSVQASVAVELEWALASAGRLDFRRDHADLAAAYDRHPELAERVQAFWQGDRDISCHGFIELMALAHLGGLLFSTDAGALIARLPELCRASPTDLDFASESEHDRAALLSRLEVLRTSASMRKRYVQLISDVWAMVGGVWEKEGRPAVEAAVTARRRAAAGGASWQEVAKSLCDPVEVDDLVSRLAPDHEVVVVPAYFTHFGLLIDLSGVLVIGVRTESAAAESRARTEALARRLKALADPTRLAILDSLAGGPTTVTALAQAFDLAQPTVSNHVKVLREAGLVTNARDGGRRQLVVRIETVTDLLDHLRAVLGQVAS